MKLSLLAVGRLGRSPEADLVTDYIKRANLAGRSLGITPVELVEVESRKSGKGPEGEVLLSALGEDAYLIACDEHGSSLTSRQLSAHIAKLRDTGTRRLVFAIGGADGLAPEILAVARDKLAFGVQTWPHALARVMLAEQIYRAMTIMTGSPYHRD